MQVVTPVLLTAVAPAYSLDPQLEWDRRSGGDVKCGVN
jgi:hypothetical protein